MARIHISALTSIILASAVMVSQVNAEENFESPVNITPQVGKAYAGTNYTDTWLTAGSTSEFLIQNSSNSQTALLVSSSGNANLANTVFIDRTQVEMGIGTATPEDTLHVKGNGNLILEQESGAAKWKITTRADGGIGFRDMPSGNDPFSIDANAPTDSVNIASSGNVGFGTADPTEAVDVVGTDEAARFKLTSVTNTGNEAAQYIQRRARSEGGNPAAVQNSDVIGFFSFRGWNGTGWTGTKAGISVTATEDWSETQNGNLVTISHTPNGSNTLTAALQIKGQADVYIPNGNLYVKGSKMNVPDYVFKDNYKLMPLDELKVYVEKNNHLPGVVSADEVGKAGVVNLSGLQMTLLEKVEELTLYTLQQEEKIARLEAMQTRLTKLESLLTNLALDTSNSNKEKVSMK